MYIIVGEFHLNKVDYLKREWLEKIMNWSFMQGPGKETINKASLTGSGNKNGKLFFSLHPTESWASNTQRQHSAFWLSVFSRFSASISYYFHS